MPANLSQNLMSLRFDLVPLVGRLQLPAEYYHYWLSLLQCCCAKFFGVGGTLTCWILSLLAVIAPILLYVFLPCGLDAYLLNIVIAGCYCSNAVVHIFTVWVGRLPAEYCHC